MAQESSASSAVLAASTHKLPFYLLDLGLINSKFFRPQLDKDYRDHIRMQKDKTLKDKYPKHEHPIAAMFVEREWIENCLWSETDGEGMLATDDPFLAAYALKSAQNINPKARLHPFSKLLTEDDYKELDKKFTVPGPKKYNLVPKTKLTIEA